MKGSITIASYELTNYKLNENSRNYLKSHTKRITDIIGSIIGILLLFPLFLVACIFVFTIDRVPCLFKQERIGFKGEPFTIIKLRTLKIIETRDKVNYHRIQEKPKYETTFTGDIWRKTSIDEIVQFWLVLKGEMSLIGHRSIPMYYLPHLYRLEGLDETQVNHYINIISHLKPGMSSLASVKGRGNLLLQEKFLYDLKYAETSSLYLDLKLLVKTLYVVILCKGAK